ncbi:MAG: SHOCT domain-containing protein [Candidatus Nanopelagicales bacterium]
MGLLRMAARTAVVAGTATAVSGRVANKQQQKYAAQEQEQQAQQAQAAPAPVAPAPEPVPAADDSMAQLQKLADLHKAGVLTDEEFAASKAKILGI